VELVDIASGPGRYVIDVLAYSQLKGLVQAHLFDVDRNGLAFGKKRAENLGIDKIEFQYRDAFAEETDPNIKGRADVAIASGLYELFSDNAMVSRSLSILAERVRDNGFLIYTNQPWHPQLEFIAEVLTNRHGQPWVMRCRSQEEMDELVRNAGFEKLSMKSDDAGIFTVSVARKIRNCGDGHSFRKMETTVAA
jgi:SAM-dependent methyltransferase